MTPAKPNRWAVVLITSDGKRMHYGSFLDKPLAEERAKSAKGFAESEGWKVEVQRYVAMGDADAYFEPEGWLS